MRGTLIMISGPECAGKDTQIKLLQTEMTARGIPVIGAREPGGTVIGNQIRTIFKDPSHAATMHPLTSLFLINAARAQLVQEVFKPTLSEEIHLLVNRSFVCTIAYQGSAEGLSLPLVRDISWAAMDDVMPDKIFVLDISVETMRKRIEARGGAELDRYDSKPATLVNQQHFTSECATDISLKQASTQN